MDKLDYQILAELKKTQGRQHPKSARPFIFPFQPSSNGSKKWKKAA